METDPDSAQSGLVHDRANGTSGDEIDDALADDHNHPATTTIRRAEPGCAGYSGCN